MNLERKVKVFDTLIDFMAHTLLFDFLPEEVLWRIRYANTLVESLGFDAMMRPVEGGTK